MKDPVSIIIPAHNEEKVISTTITALLPGISDKSIELIVVCNGCSDNTAEIVRTTCPSATCVIIPNPSKTKALNLGDSYASYFPRIYQDADVVLSTKAAHDLASVLRQGTFFAASPHMKMELSHSSWAVKSYYTIWQKLDYVKEGMIGTGVYALSEAGRNRFDIFPHIIADDGYVRALFKTDERTSVDNCFSLVRAPINLDGLIRIKTRSRRGRYELIQKFPELLSNEEKNYLNSSTRLVKHISLWPQITIYLCVNLLTRFLAKRTPAGNNKREWEKDESSRNTKT